jgi:hypothetical protein
MVVRGGQERFKQCLMGKTYGRRLLGRPRHGGENNFKVDLLEVG